MRSSYVSAFLIPAMAVALAAPAHAREAALGGSRSSMFRQHAAAVQEDYSFFRTPAEVRRQADAGRLVRVENGEDYALSKVSFPEARPEVLAFIERFAGDYRRETGNRLIITSLTRPAALQPRNAHRLSVHPAGMAVDLRVPMDASSRAWLERSLLAMERDGLLDVTREKNPAHYHVAVFAVPFMRYEARRDSLDAIRAAEVEVERRAAVTRALASIRVAQEQPLQAPGAHGLPLFAAALALALVLTARIQQAKAKLRAALVRRRT